MDHRHGGKGTDFASSRFFNQPRKDALIQGEWIHEDDSPRRPDLTLLVGPKKKYPLVTGGEFTANAMKMYYAALKAATENQDDSKAVPQVQSRVVAATA